VLSLFIKQCLTEEKYGSTFISEIESRVEQLNLTQLQKMHACLTEASQSSKVKVWKEGNDAVLSHVNKWLALRSREHQIEVDREEAIQRKIRARQKAKEVNAREAERVMRQLKEKAHEGAVQEIKDIETKKKAEFKEKYIFVVEEAEKRRFNHIVAGCTILLIGCVLCGLFITDLIVLITAIGVIIIISFFPFIRGYKVGKVAPYDDDPLRVERAINIREEELFLKSLNVLKQVIFWHAYLSDLFGCLHHDTILLICYSLLCSNLPRMKRTSKGVCFLIRRREGRDELRDEREK
jgi:hypothetical protein